MDAITLCNPERHSRWDYTARRPQGYSGIEQDVQFALQIHQIQAQQQKAQVAQLAANAMLANTLMNSYNQGQQQANEQYRALQRRQSTLDMNCTTRPDALGTVTECKQTTH